MFRVTSDIMPHWYNMWSTIVIAIDVQKKYLRIDVYHKQSLWNEMSYNILGLEPCNFLYKLISDIMEHWYDMWNSIVIATNFCNAKIMICALMFIINNHYGLICLNNLLQLEPCNVTLGKNSNLQCIYYQTNVV